MVLRQGCIMGGQEGQQILSTTRLRHRSLGKDGTAREGRALILNHSPQPGVIRAILREGSLCLLRGL